MVKVSINGKKLDREFQNMAQALAFAYQNGECYGAEKVEIAQEAAIHGGGGGGKPHNHNAKPVNDAPVSEQVTETPKPVNDGSEPDPENGTEGE